MYLSSGVEEFGRSKVKQEVWTQFGLVKLEMSIRDKEKKLRE